MVGLTNDEKDSSQAVTILLYAVCAGDDGLDVVNLLVKHGADVNEGFISPLRLARQLGAHKVAKLLCRHGAVEDAGRAYTLREIEMVLYPERKEERERMERQRENENERERREKKESARDEASHQ